MPRPDPRTTEPDPVEAAAQRRTRALEEPLDVLPHGDPRFLRLEVRNPRRGSRYTVVLPAFPSRDGGFCSCTDFARRGLGTCKHLEAAWIWTQEHPAEAAAPRAARPAGRLWTEIDRRLKLRARSHRGPRSLRGPGKALLNGDG